MDYCVMCNSMNVRSYVVYGELGNSLSAVWALGSLNHRFNSADVIKFTIHTFIDEQTRKKCRSTQSTFKSDVKPNKSDLNLLIGMMRKDIDRQRDWRTLMV